MPKNENFPPFLKQIRVYDTWYEIKIRTDPEHEDDFGLVNLRTATITLNDLPPLSYKLRVLWHELIHVNQSCRCTELDEDEATRFSQFINQVLLDNPNLVEAYWQLQHGRPSRMQRDMTFGGVNKPHGKL